MKINYMFLLIGIILSAGSKISQFRYKNDLIGNILVIPSASFLCLAVLFSIKKYMKLYNSVGSRTDALIIAALALGTVISFQIAMILFVQLRSSYGLIFILPLLTCIVLFFRFWLKY